MSKSDIREVKVMLEALLRSQGLIEWVGGWVGGRTSNDDPFIVLYPSSENLREKVCRVYPHQFKRLPSFIPTDDVPGDTDGNPSKDKAQRAGIYHECPPFKIVMHLGKETQMGREKRFSNVLYVPAAASANSQQSKPTSQPAPATNGSAGSQGEQKVTEPARDLFDLSYADGIDVADPGNKVEMAAFSAYERAHAGSAPMNRRELRRWWKKHGEGGG